MCGWECSGCWRGYCRVVGDPRRALSRFVIEGYPSNGSCSSPMSSSSTAISGASFSFSFPLPSGPPPESPLKAAPKPSSESSAGPLKGNEGPSSSHSGSPGLGFSADFAGAVQGAILSLVSIWCSSALQKCCQSRRTGCTTRGCRYAKTAFLGYQKVKTGSTVDYFDHIVLFVPPLAPAAS